MIKESSTLKDETEYLPNFNYYVREILMRIIRTNLSRIRKILFNKCPEGIKFYLKVFFRIQQNC